MSGRHGEFVYVQRGNSYFVRAYVPHLRKKRTEDQIKGQNRFTQCGKLYHKLEDEVKQILKTCMTGNSQSGRNLFISMNYHAMATDSNEVVCERLQFSRGRLQLPRNMEAVYQGDGQWELTWENLDWETDVKGNDRLYIIEYHTDPYLCPRLIRTVEAVRSDGRAHFAPYHGRQTEEVHFYCFFGRAGQQSFSDTVYLRGWVAEAEMEQPKDTAKDAKFRPLHPVVKSVRYIPVPAVCQFSAGPPLACSCASRGSRAGDFHPQRE